jgi:hypothetical protein
MRIQNGSPSLVTSLILDAIQNKITRSQIVVSVIHNGSPLTSVRLPDQHFQHQLELDRNVESWGLPTTESQNPNLHFNKTPGRFSLHSKV